MKSKEEMNAETKESAEPVELGLLESFRTKWIKEEREYSILGNEAVELLKSGYLVKQLVETKNDADRVIYYTYEYEVISSRSLTLNITVYLLPEK